MPTTDPVAQFPADATRAHPHFARLRDHLNACILGQEALVERLLIALLADGHLLVEGAPGLAKTKAVRALARAIEGDDHRIQFTPDLLPADLTGTDVYRPEDGSFAFQPGPVFHNLVLADEINRAPAKVQSALLEAMAERQVTVGRRTYPLPRLFLVMATQNPLEQEGTYPLPEAQLDRFLMHARIDYPTVESERKILALVRREARGDEAPPLATISQSTIFAARREVLDLYLSPALEEYVVQLVVATRAPRVWGADLAHVVRCGASPRGTIALERCARAHAWLRGAEFVAPEDVHAVAKDVLRHRILLTFEAEADGLTPDRFLDALLERVPLA
ncbi:MAG TPA: AAA family ATPase [Candidatus Binatia bacterium]|nr:AAA family ATPase [Candidatus Binatia bacterium]